MPGVESALRQCGRWLTCIVHRAGETRHRGTEPCCQAFPLASEAVRHSPTRMSSFYCLPAPPPSRILLQTCTGHHPMRAHRWRSTLRSLARGSRRGLAVLAFGAFGLQVATTGSQVCSMSAAYAAAAMDTPMTSAPLAMDEGAPLSPMHHSSGPATVIMSGCTTCVLSPVIAIAVVSALPCARGVPANYVRNVPRSWSLAPDVPPPRA